MDEELLLDDVDELDDEELEDEELEDEELEDAEPELPPQATRLAIKINAGMSVRIVFSFLLLIRQSQKNALDNQGFFYFLALQPIGRCRPNGIADARCVDIRNWLSAHAFTQEKAGVRRLVVRNVLPGDGGAILWIVHQGI